MSAARDEAVSRIERDPSLRALREAGREPGRRGAEIEAVIGALQADPFDPVALEALVQQELSRREDWMAAAQDAWLARVTAMSPDQREVYADRLLDVMQGAPEKRGWFGRGRD